MKKEDEETLKTLKRVLHIVVTTEETKKDALLPVTKKALEVLYIFGMMKRQEVEMGEEEAEVFKELLEKMERAWKCLREPERQTIELLMFEGMTVEEAALEMECDPMTVYRRRRRAAEKVAITFYTGEYVKEKRMTYDPYYAEQVRKAERKKNERS